MAISVLSHSSLIAGRRLKHRRVSTGWATPIATNSRLLLFTPIAGPDGVLYETRCEDTKDSRR